MTNARWNLWLLSLAALAVLTTSPLRLGYGQTPAPLKHDVIINEIHYHPDVKTELVEFIELYNKSSAAVDLSGWRLTKAVEYTFPAGTSIPANGYVVVTENPAAFQAKFKTSALGPWTGVLSNDGETIRLLDAAKRVVNEVAYQEGFPWPTVGDAPGYSIELINPNLDNTLGGNWRCGSQAGSTAAAQEVTLFPSASSWHYRKGTSEASTPIGAWRELSFVEDGTWQVHNAPVGYDPLETAAWARLDDMNGNYTSVFLRKTFTVTDPSQFASWRLEAFYDDGFNCWINGRRVAFAQVTGENLPYDSIADGVAREANTYDTFTLTDDPAVVLKPGLNVIAVQFFNILKSSSSDAFFDARLIASTGGAANPSPGKRNSVYLRCDPAGDPTGCAYAPATPLQPAGGDHGPGDGRQRCGHRAAVVSDRRSGQLQLQERCGLRGFQELGDRADEG